MPDRLSKSAGVFGILTTILGGLPFLIFLGEKAFRVISDPDTWYASGNNHGPWRAQVEALTLYYPVLVLSVGTLIVLIAKGMKERRPRIVAAGVVLVLLQIGILGAQMYFLTWLVD
jgi:hypothetical protein